MFLVSYILSFKFLHSQKLSVIIVVAFILKLIKFIENARDHIKFNVFPYDFIIQRLKFCAFMCVCVFIYIYI